MDDELITEKSWWKDWKWILPISAMVLIGIGVFIVIFQLKEVKTERGNGIAFEKEKWNAKSDFGYINRNKMLQDLIVNDKLKKLNKDEILELLGKPDRIDNEYLFYRISHEKMGLLTLHVSTLVIKLNDSVDKAVMIHE